MAGDMDSVFNETPKHEAPIILNDSNRCVSVFDVILNYQRLQRFLHPHELGACPCKALTPDRDTRSLLSSLLPRNETGFLAVVARTRIRVFQVGFHDRISGDEKRCFSLLRYGQIQHIVFDLSEVLENSDVKTGFLLEIDCSTEQIYIHLHGPQKLRVLSMDWSGEDYEEFVVSANEVGVHLDGDAHIDIRFDGVSRVRHALWKEKVDLEGIKLNVEPIVRECTVFLK